MTVSEIIASTKITNVWEALGGETPKHGRARAFWRGGDNHNAVAISNKIGCWHDWVTNESGGILDLIQKALSCNRPAALKWLSELTGIPVDGHDPTPEQRREYARRKAKAEQKAREVTYWRDALIVEANQRKIKGAVAGDDDELGRAAQLCNLLENGSADQIVAEFDRQNAHNPYIVARLIDAGAVREREAEEISALLTIHAMIAG